MVGRLTLKLMLFTEKVLYYTCSKANSNWILTWDWYCYVIKIYAEILSLLIDIGKLYTFGDGSNGQLGHGTTLLQSDKPSILTWPKSKKIRKVSCGENHTAIITGKFPFMPSVLSSVFCIKYWCLHCWLEIHCICVIHVIVCYVVQLTP